MKLPILSGGDLAGSVRHTVLISWLVGGGCYSQQIRRLFGSSWDICRGVFIKFNFTQFGFLSVAFVDV